MVQLPKAGLIAPHEIRSWPARAGISAGDRILLIADLTRLAWKFRKAGQRFHPDNFLDLFLDHLGPDGTLVIPTFNYDLKNGENFDLERTPTISGSLGQAALGHTSFQRTSHPLHSFAVGGMLQKEFLLANDPSSFGTRSPFALLKQHSFKLLAIDIGLEPAFTYVHFVEESKNVPYRKRRQIHVNYTDRDGKSGERIFELYAKQPGYVNDFKALETILRSKNMLVEEEIDGSKFLKMDLSDAHNVIEEDIRSNRARSIVQFKWEWWIRDLVRPFISEMRPSRSAIISGENAAGPHR